MLKSTLPQLGRSQGFSRARATTGFAPLPDAAPARSIARTFLAGLLGAVVLWASFPPVDWPWLAWVAPVGWLWLCLGREGLGWRGYAGLWLAGTVHWLMMLEGIRLAHPALYAGWIALAAYLGVYLPVFVGLTRVAVQRLCWPLVFAAPVVWVGLELVRGHLITGFSMGLLAHTQAVFPRLIQIADLGGGYALSLVVMLVATCFTEIVWRWRERSAARWWAQPTLRLVGVSALAIFGTLGYGTWRLRQPPVVGDQRTLKVALIQGSLDTVFEVSAERVRETFEHYRKLTEAAVSSQANLDLVVWPESMFVASETVIEEPLVPPPEAKASADDVRRRLAVMQEDFSTLLAGEVARVNANTESSHAGTKLLVGSTTYAYGTRVKIFNSALLADRGGEVVGRYYKTHPVMFGEYIPFGEALPWLYRITPMAGGLSIGEGPKVFEVAGLGLSPSVCFESTIPHLIRGQLAELARRGTPADVLVNVTNDGWFWGTGMLDLHFRCGVFRAVENRKPLIVAANTGISAQVDGNGVIRQRGPKRGTAVLIAEVARDGRRSFYGMMGDWLGWGCAVVCLGLGTVGWRGISWRERVGAVRRGTVLNNE